MVPSWDQFWPWEVTCGVGENAGMALLDGLQGLCATVWVLSVLGKCLLCLKQHRTGRQVGLCQEPVPESGSAAAAGQKTLVQGLAASGPGP